MTNVLLKFSINSVPINNEGISVKQMLFIIFLEILSLRCSNALLSTFFYIELFNTVSVLSFDCCLWHQESVRQTSFDSVGGNH
jgi:hypothetical protein